jgi:D-glycero-D-manno-heptose 1,7-bisphosphate phosphatase
MLEIKTFIISAEKPTTDPGYKFSWSPSLCDVILILKSEPVDCFIIDYSTENLGFGFDRDLFVNQAKEFSVAQALAWRINTGKNIVSIDNQYKMIEEKKSRIDVVRDGLERVPLYYFSKESVLHFIKEEGIVLPLGEHALPVAFSKKNLNYRRKLPALFLDRDGVINKDDGYVFKHENIEYMEDIFSLIKVFNERDWPVFVLTNQSGAAQGKYSERDVIQLHKEMEVDLFKRDAIIKEWVYSPYHLEKGIGDLKRLSFTRKPGSGMALFLLERYAIDIERSFMVGDKKSDRILLKGLPFLQIKGRYPFNESSTNCFNNLLEIKKHILEKTQEK